MFEKECYQQSNPSPRLVKVHQFNFQSLKTDLKTCVAMRERESFERMIPKYAFTCFHIEFSLEVVVLTAQFQAWCEGSIKTNTKNLFIWYQDNFMH